MFTRLHIPYNLKNYPRVIYLDSDVIARQSIHLLWEEELDGFPFAAIPDYSERTTTNGLGWHKTLDYCNSGVILFNTVLWRQKYAEVEIISVYKDIQPSLRYPDQDLLNYLSRGEWKRLPFRYNRQYIDLRERTHIDFGQSKHEFARDLRDPVLIHLTYYPKPWMGNPFVPFRSLYRAYTQKISWMPDVPSVDFRTGLRLLYWTMFSHRTRLWVRQEIFNRLPFLQKRNKESTSVAEIAPPRRAREQIIIACATDSAFVAATITMLYSLLDSNRDERFKVYILDCGLTETEKKEFLKLLEFDAEIIFRQVGAGQLTGLYVSGHVSVATYARLFIAELIPEEERVLYLDGDILVRGSLRPVWDFPIQDVFVAATRDTGVTDITYLGRKDPNSYFNAGVMCVNLFLWRAEDLTFKLKELAQSNKYHFRVWDQDVLNCIVGTRWKDFGPRFNYTTHEFYRKGGTTSADATCIHFVTACKAWSVFSRIPFISKTRLYAREYMRIGKRLKYKKYDYPRVGTLSIIHFIYVQACPRWLRSVFRSLKEMYISCQFR